MSANESTTQESIDANHYYGRPEDCSCLPTFDDLPCWACYLDGHDTPNPHATDD